MSATKYTFSIANDFPNQAVSSDLLTAEIQMSAIVTALDHIDTAGDVCDVWFKDALSVGDEGILDALVAAHTGAAQAPDPTLVTLNGVATTLDGRLEIRHTAAKRTTTFKLRAFTIHTADLVGGIHNVNPVTGADYSDLTVKLYDANGDEITDAANEGDAVKTVVDWMPTYNYEIIGGIIDIPSAIIDGVTNQWFLSAIGVPDLPPQSYGSIDFVSEVNLEAATLRSVRSDGRAVSYLPYNLGGYPTNKLRFTFKHPVGVQKRFQVYIEHFTS